MSLAKIAQPVDFNQVIDYEGESVPYDGFSYEEGADLEVSEPEDSEQLALDCAYSDDDQELAHGGLHVEEMPQGFVFELPTVPGGEFQDDIEEPHEIEVEDEEIEVESDPWKWQVANFCEWLQDKMQGIPRHSGRDSAGLERASAYLEQLDREISRAVRQDLNNEIAIGAVEKARDEIHKGLERLQDRLEKVMSSKYPKRKANKKKKKADVDTNMVKEASKGAYYGSMTVTVPILISGIARACINSMVSAGKDIEDEFQKLAKQYSLDKREEFMLYQALSDMGYHIRRPRGTELNEKVDRTSTENTGWVADYPG